MFTIAKNFYCVRAAGKLFSFPTEHRFSGLTEDARPVWTLVQFNCNGLTGNPELTMVYDIGSRDLEAEGYVTDVYFELDPIDFA